MLRREIDPRVGAAGHLDQGVEIPDQLKAERRVGLVVGVVIVADDHMLSANLLALDGAEVEERRIDFHKVTQRTCGVLDGDGRGIDLAKEYLAAHPTACSHDLQAAAGEHLEGGVPEPLVNTQRIPLGGVDFGVDDLPVSFVEVGVPVPILVGADHADHVRQHRALDASLIQKSSTIVGQPVDVRLTFDTIEGRTPSIRTTGVFGFQTWTYVCSHNLHGGEDHAVHAAFGRGDVPDVPQIDSPPNSGGVFLCDLDDQLESAPLATIRTEDGTVTRHIFIRGSGEVVIGAIVVLLAAASIACHPPASKPNPVDVLIVTIDTLRADSLEPYGAIDTLTPNIARFAEKGVVYESATTPITVTRPAHSSIFTGLYPDQHGVLHNGYVLPDDVLTLAEILKGQGYQTGGFVGVRLLGRPSGIGQGFDEFDAPVEQVQRRARMVVDPAIEWLTAADPEAPVLMWVHLYDPHLSYNPPSAFRRGVDPELSKKPQAHQMEHSEKGGCGERRQCPG